MADQQELSAWNWGWDAVAALGQVAGAVGTFIAVAFSIGLAWRDHKRVQRNEAASLQALRRAQYLRARHVKVDANIMLSGARMGNGWQQWNQAEIQIKASNLSPDLITGVEIFCWKTEGEMSGKADWSAELGNLQPSGLVKTLFVQRSFTPTSAPPNTPSPQPPFFVAMAFQDVDAIWWLSTHRGELQETSMRQIQAIKPEKLS